MMRRLIETFKKDCFKQHINRVTIQTVRVCIERILTVQIMQIVKFEKSVVRMLFFSFNFYNFREVDVIRLQR